MRIALVHDYLKEFGGAERVLEELHNIYPESEVYTLVYLPKFLGPHRVRFKNWKIRPSILQCVPMKGKLISLFRLIDPLVFRMMDLSKYDLVITSKAGNYSSINSFKKGKDTKHICYCHTPPRYLYGYATANKWTTNIVRKMFLALGQIPMHFLRMYDFWDAQKPDYFIVNSKEIASRVKKFYRRESVVIHPPIDIPKLEKVRPINERKYYLTGGRLARAKRFDLAVEACTKLNLPLKVFGKGFGGYGENDLRKIAGESVEFLGEVNQKDKWELIKNAKAYISPSLQEDFGMLNLEVNAGGTPVIAYKSGGVLETLVDGKTGVFFEEPSAESLIKAIKQFDNLSIKPVDCINQAKKFGRDVFEEKMRRFVKSI